MLFTAEQHEKIAQAYYKAAQDKNMPPAKRMEFRTKGAKRFRILAKLAREEEARKARRESL